MATLEWGAFSRPAKMDVSDKQASLPRALEDFETIAQEVSGLGQRVSDLEERLEHVEKVNTGLEEAALTTARALQDISAHWDKVYEAIRRKERSME
jgi:predicted  nucleic acid-binding Zn-ribbon protein